MADLRPYLPPKLQPQPAPKAKPIAHRTLQDMTCKTCAAFLDYNDNTNSGECRRRAPTIDGGDAVWPSSSRFQCCFEWVEKGGAQ